MIRLGVLLLTVGALVVALPGVVLVVAGATVVALAVSLELGWWWVAGAVAMAAVQALALGLATNAANSP